MVRSGRASIMIAPMTQPVAYRARRITTRVDSETPSVFGTATVKALPARVSSALESLKIVPLIVSG